MILYNIKGIYQEVRKSKKNKEVSEPKNGREHKVDQTGENLR